MDFLDPFIFVLARHTPTHRSVFFKNQIGSQDQITSKLYRSVLTMAPRRKTNRKNENFPSVEDPDFFRERFWRTRTTLRRTPCFFLSIWEVRTLPKITPSQFFIYHTIRLVLLRSSCLVPSFSILFFSKIIIGAE